MVLVIVTTSVLLMAHKAQPASAMINFTPLGRITRIALISLEAELLPLAVTLNTLLLVLRLLVLLTLPFALFVLRAGRFILAFSWHLKRLL